MKKPEEVFIDFREKLVKVSDKKSRVREIVDFSIVYGDCYGSRIIELLEEGIVLAKESDDKVGETLCYCNLAFTNRVTGLNAPSPYAVTFPELSKMVEDISFDLDAYTMGINMLSYFHWFRGEYEMAFNLAFKGLRISEQNKVAGVGWDNFGLAVFYYDTKDFENSRIHYSKAFDIFKDLRHEYGMARSSNGLGTVAIAQSRIDDALPLLEFSHTIYQKMSHYAGLSRAATDLGLVEKCRKNYLTAVAYFNEGLALRKEIDHFHGLATSYTELGETYLLMGQHDLATEHLDKGLVLALQLQAHQKQSRIHKLMYDTYKELKNTELALRHFEKYFEVRSRILNDEAANNIKKIQTRFEKEKSEKEAELERFKNIELKKANTIIEQKNKDITDSINYARRIQHSILPSKEILDKCFKNYFVLYKPKDIVSGDFYWSVKTNNRETNQDLSVIAAVDCTGHGVPGAFMSMLGNTLLNQTITDPRIVSASDVLNYLQCKLPDNLKTHGEEQNIRDGMDMSLCIFDLDNNKLQFAGANNPCWIVRNNELTELKADKQAITASTDMEKREFTNYNFELRKDDCVYLFTDGFADQFGGPDEKKFGHRRLRELLLTMSNKPCHDQKKILEKTFEHWRGTLEQIDDVCFIGVKI